MVEIEIGIVIEFDPDGDPDADFDHQKIPSPIYERGLSDFSTYYDFIKPRTENPKLKTGNLDPLAPS